MAEQANIEGWADQFHDRMSQEKKVTQMTQDEAKRNAAAAALEYVEDGMTLGLGTGSTAAFFVEFLAEEIAEGLKIKGVPTSLATQKQAESLGIPLIPVEQVERIHLTIDGADECDPMANLIKGGGRAF